jgi:hypothetical protein
MSNIGTRKTVLPFAGTRLCAVLSAVGVAALAACSTPQPASAPPAPTYYASPPVPNPQHGHRPATATPASATTGGAPSDTTAPAAAPQGQVPADAQPPAAVPPPGGQPPHDSSEYIEPPSR